MLSQASQTKIIGTGARRKDLHPLFLDIEKKMKSIPLPMNAARVCNAIARIGYEPHSALMDIIDNSVAAGALNVRVIIDLVEGKTINQRNNVARYRVVDNGKGMDETGIKNAFMLGSDGNYQPNSLSKYGMGLKSAGFSLGTRIQLVSKKNGELSDKYYLDRQIIENSKDYVICTEELSTKESDEYSQLINANTSGTVVEITGCGTIYHASAKSTIDKLKHRLGVTYFPFLSTPKEERRLTISLTYPGELNYSVQPLDILFVNDAEENFDPEKYTGALPCFAFKNEWNLATSSEGEVPPIKLEVVTFPKDGMSNNASPLSADEKLRIKSYRVSRENKGFFVYRNGRLIRWGDDLDDIVGKDLLGFRARMELTTDHDDLLHVDVSKQRLEMDDETRNNLEVLMRLPKRQSKQIFELCDDKINQGNGEGAGFSETAADVPEEDPIAGMSPADPAMKKFRAKKREAESEASVKKVQELEKKDDGNLGDSKDDNNSSDPDNEFRKVRYSDVLPGMDLWSTQKDPIQGTFVLINRRHAFYQSILSNFDESSPSRLAIEALIFCCAIGENQTYENLTKVPEGDIQEVLRRFYVVLSYNLGEWAGGNQNLFDK